MQALAIGYLYYTFKSQLVAPCHASLLGLLVTERRNRAAATDNCNTVTQYFKQQCSRQYCYTNLTSLICFNFTSIVLQNRNAKCSHQCLLAEFGLLVVLPRTILSQGVILLLLANVEVTSVVTSSIVYWYRTMIPTAFYSHRFT